MAGGLRRSTVVSLVALAIIAAGYLGVTKNHGGASPVSPAVAQGAEAARGELVVHATGDVMLDPTQLGLLAASPSAPWTGVRKLFGADDVTIVNLECGPGAGGQRQDKKYTFRCADPRAQSAMRAAGVEVANMGNNHSGDFGIGAMLDGRARLVRAGLKPVGAGRNAAEAEAPALFERAGRTIAVLGFSRVVPVATWRAKANRPGVADGYVIPTMVRAVRAAKASADLVFVTIHWGNEGEAEPLAEDVARAHALVDAGADAVFGHHAHRLQPLRFYKGRPIFFGLGNFVWPRNGPTAIAEVRVAPGGSIRACLIPATITGGRPVLSRSKC
jgi:poly-gamma-glutamate synthesis protein (capsule biosynthesis protein)